MQIWIFKQWHLAPGVNTRAPQRKDLPQELPQARNQTAIFLQLDRWISEGHLDNLIAEGCEGELQENTPLVFNGWSFAELKAASTQPSFAEIVSHIPMKLKAKYTGKILALCGDNQKLLDENNRQFSDIRGTFGFLSRILEFQNDPAKLKPYLEGAIQTFHLPQYLSALGTIQRLRKLLKNELKEVQTTIQKRNLQILRVIQDIAKTSNKPVAVVFGGLHTAGLKKLLEKDGFSCSVVQPSGYQADETELIKTLESKL